MIFIFLGSVSLQLNRFDQAQNYGKKEHVEIKKTTSDYRSRLVGIIIIQ